MKKQTDFDPTSKDIRRSALPETAEWDVVIRKSRRAKYISISVKPPGIVSVAVPMKSSFEKAENVLRAKIGWIRKHIEKFKSAGNGNVIENTMPLPDNTKGARDKIISRLMVLVSEHGFKINRVFIRNQKTRWGSCSGANNINLNIRIASLPENLMDYVILHELVHTRQKNHGRFFWSELDNYVGNARDLRKSLRKYHII